jgi:hypothetical protein
VSALRDARLRDPGFLELACGLRAMIDRFDRVLADHGAEEPGAADLAGAAAPTELTEVDELTEVVLGLIALRDRIAGALFRAANCAGAPAAADQAPPPRDGLLR